MLKPPRKPKIPLVAERKLGREKAHGICWSTGHIEIDPRATERQRVDTLVHEVLHHQFPAMPEADVARHATIIAKVLWKEGYRRTG